MEITLKELLDAREERVIMQAKMQKEYPCPLVCFTMNIAGPIKISPIIVRAFRYGLSLLEKRLSGYIILKRHTEYLKSGPVSFYSVLGNAQSIKDICIGIEESCHLGRLFDMDVIDTNGKKLERSSQRCCIVCGKEGRECAAGRVHSVDRLQKTTQQIITEHFINEDSRKIAELAKNSLIKEVLTTPKPGLVDQANNGSHTDMNVESFKKSADAIFPYFMRCVKIGIETSGLSADYTFNQLRIAGIDAERDMYLATNGINTHKGIIYSMGVISGAIGRLWIPEMPIANTESVLEECAALVKYSVDRDFADIDGSTAGGRLYLLNGKRGIRGEVALGFPSVKNTAIPAYKQALSEGKNGNDAGVIALLHLIAEIYDTSIYNRGGEDGVFYAREYAKELLSRNTLSLSDVEKMDEAFIKKNLSPGGAADLLAITYLFSDLEVKREELIK